MSEHYFLAPGDVVLLLGNSITAQAQPMVDVLVEGLRRRYPELTDGPGRVRFVLSGVGGEQACEGAGRLAGLIEEHRPTVCVVGYGTCEVTFRNEPSFVPAMRQIVGRFLATTAAGARVTIVGAPPAQEDNWRQEAWPARQFLEGLPRVAEAARSVAKNAGVPYVDAMAAMGRDGTGWTTDGIHLNEYGYGALARAIHRAWGFGENADGGRK